MASGDELARQRRLQIDAFGVDPYELKAEALVHFLSWNVQAATLELAEALNDAVPSWKPWSVGEHQIVDRRHFIEELVDARHFLDNLLLAAKVDDAELEKVFDAKTEIIAKRQASGTYEG